MHLGYMYNLMRCQQQSQTGFVVVLLSHSCSVYTIKIITIYGMASGREVSKLVIWLRVMYLVAAALKSVKCYVYRREEPIYSSSSEHEQVSIKIS